MGFPLHRGSVQDGILTCHWHHARFDLCTGGAFDLWADDVPAYPAEVRDGAVYVDLSRREEPLRHLAGRLRLGLERNLSLVIAKTALSLEQAGADPLETFRSGVEFGVRNRREGWGSGLVMHTALFNLRPALPETERPRAMYHGLSAAAADAAGRPVRFTMDPLPGEPPDGPTLKRWFRRFVEVRDGEGAERCLITAIRAGLPRPALEDLLFAAVTDHRYLDAGHTLDFTNKAIEALDHLGWQPAEAVLTSLVPSYAGARRAEESNAWRHPVDLVALLHTTWERLPSALAEGHTRRDEPAVTPEGLAEPLLSEDPHEVVEALVQALRNGATLVDLAGCVAYAAALRIARFPTTNEFGDWDTALHTFTFANAVHRALRRCPAGEPSSDGEPPPLLRGVFDAAVSVYLDRFLNVPPVRLPSLEPQPGDPGPMLDELSDLLDRQQQADAAGELAARFLAAGGDPAAWIGQLGRLLLREDRNFHTIQMVEAGMQQQAALRGTPAAGHVLVATTRYLAAHAPTMRSQLQTFEIARRLAHGEHVFE
jgi:hypothetical protein